MLHQMAKGDCVGWLILITGAFKLRAFSGYWHRGESEIQNTGIPWRQCGFSSLALQKSEYCNKESCTFFFLVLPVYCYQPISLHPQACMLSHVTPWTAAHQAPLSVDFSRQEYWSKLPFPSLRVVQMF